MRFSHIHFLMPDFHILSLLTFMFFVNKFILVHSPLFATALQAGRDTIKYTVQLCDTCLPTPDKDLLDQK